MSIAQCISGSGGLKDEWVVGCTGCSVSTLSFPHDLIFEEVSLLAKERGWKRDPDPKYNDHIYCPSCYLKYFPELYHFPEPHKYPGLLVTLWKIFKR
jgi:hypothetical protein